MSPSSSSSSTPTLAFPFTQSFSLSSHSSLSNVPFSQPSSPPPVFLPNGSTSTIPPIIPVPFTQSSSNSSTSVAPTNVHPMVTRSKSGALKSKSFLSSLSVDPQTVSQALQDPDWYSAMQLELHALHKTALGHLCHHPLVVMLSGVGGCSNSSINLMAVLTDERHDL